MNKLTKFFFVALFAMGTLPIGAQNTKKTVTQVTTTIDITDDVDYIISGATPFGDTGVVNIVNTDHAVLIINQMKPSKVISDVLASHVKINGVVAEDGKNCQVKLYNLGAIVMPYASDIKPLTVYSEQNFEGTAVNSFGLENSGGYMNTLSAAKLNNQIRSFKLKRGYMVTFSTLPSGRGYSRCFIAADKDIEMATLPMILDKTISSYRVFKWYDAGKKQIASCTDKKVLDALNVQSCYDWGQGNASLLPDYEWVANHIYEDYPSSSTIGSITQSPHTKNNNEPKNSSDDHPQDLETILNNWENMMRTGLRLCSPASWDGSDYWNATGFLADFMDSIDARGWRCDIIDLHCYWPEGNFGNIANWANKYKRPIWISEWCWGASWNKNGAFASGVTQNDVKNALQNICSKLNSYDYVERYYYWNSEAAISKIYNNGLTPAGQYYAGMNSGLGYNGKYDFVPKNPRQYDPSKLAAAPKNGKTVLTWYDDNGEFNKKMEVQRMDADGTWKTLAEVEIKEEPSKYTYEDDYQGNTAYRIHLVDLNNKDRYSGEAYTSVPFGTSTIQYGTLKLNSVSSSVGIPFLSPFAEVPMVFTGLMSYNSGKNGPITVPYFARGAITEKEMTFAVSPWLNQNTGGSEFTKVEEVPFLVIPAGRYKADDVDIEVGSISTGIRKGVEYEVKFQQPFAEGITPVVIATLDRVTSANAAMMHKIWDVTNVGFKCSVSLEDAVTSGFASPVFAYMAVTPGVGCLDKENNINIAAGLGDGKLYGTTPRPISFLIGEETLSLVDPYVFADLQTKNTPVPTEIKQATKSTTTIDGTKYQTGMRLYRMTDKSVTSTNIDGVAQADNVGWVAIFNQRYLDPSAIIDLRSSDSKLPLHVKVKNRIITVEGAATPDIYTAGGARVLPYSVLAPGVYFVHSNGRVAKVLVK